MSELIPIGIHRKDKNNGNDNGLPWTTVNFEFTGSKLFNFSQAVTKIILVKVDNIPLNGDVGAPIQYRLNSPFQLEILDEMIVGEDFWVSVTFNYGNVDEEIKKGVESNGVTSSIVSSFAYYLLKDTIEVDGILNNFKLYHKSVAVGTAFNFGVFRFDGTKYQQVYTKTFNVTASNALCTYFTDNFNYQAGDYVGIAPKSAGLFGYGTSTVGNIITLNSDGSAGTVSTAVISFSFSIYTQNSKGTITDRLQILENSSVEYYYKERPSNGIVNFQVPVNCGNQNVLSQTLANQDNISIHLDYGILLLPTNYVRGGAPVRLVIACHGTGTWINGASTSTTHSAQLLAQGYAVLDMNGIPAPFVSNNSAKRHYGAPFVLDSYVNGYRYVVENYNIAKDGCFVYGISMGGLSSFMLVQSSSIPVIAQGAFAPCIDLYKQAYSRPWNGAVQRQDIATYFGFTGTAPTFTATVPPTTDEVNYFNSNIDKIVGYDNMLKNVINADRANIYSINGAGVTAVINPSEDALYSTLVKIHNVPLKIWHNTNDTTVLYRYSKYYIDMVKKAGGTAFLRTFTSGGHNAWDNGDTINITTIDDGIMPIQTSIYELIQWFKRFDR